MPQVSVEHIEITPGVLGGKPRIKGRRIGVHHVKGWHLDGGESVASICKEYDLTPAQVHAALTYYYDHREEIDRRIAEDEAWVREYFKGQPSIQEKYGGKRKRGLRKIGSTKVSARETAARRRAGGSASRLVEGRKT